MELQPVEFDESEIAAYPVDETDFRTHLREYFQLGSEQLVDEDLFLEKRYRAGFVILHGKEFRKKFPRTYELGVKEGELLFETVF